MKTFTPKQVEKWDIVRAKGRGHFLVWRGIIGWGVPTAILWSLFMNLTGTGFPLARTMAMALVLFPIGGYFWGLWVWKITEKRYAASIATRTSQKDPAGSP